MECFCAFEDGTEWGWQAKHFTTALSDTQWRQLDDSVKQALDKHPKLVRYYVCVPRDRSDSRRKGITTELQKWHGRVAKWECQARDQGMEVEFIWWGSSELAERLSTEEHAGRFEFWFGDDRRFSQDWFKKRLAEARLAAGPRYTPEVHVDLPIARKLELFARSDSAMDALRSLVKDVRRAFRTLHPSRDHGDRINGEFGVDELRAAEDEILEAFSNVDFEPSRTLDFTSIVHELDRTIGLADESLQTLRQIESTGDDAAAHEEDVSGYRRDPFENWRAGLQNLRYELRAVRTTLTDADQIANSRLMIVTGEAGTGKTHLLCDFARQRVGAGLPTVILLGQRFTTTDEPWSQALKHLDMDHLPAERFIGALEAAAQASAARAILIIDALNEGEGPTIWPDHLAAFLDRARRSPWIGVLLSVRSTYQDSVIPDHVRKRTPVAEHRGFSGREYDAARTFFDHYGLELPSTPILHPEFSKPLFLKTICGALSETEEKRLPRGFQGISAIFDLHLKAINRRGCTPD